LAVLTIGAIVLLGWAFDLGSLKSLHPALVTMKANTAIGFLLTGFALVVRQRGSTTDRDRRVEQLAAGATLLLGVVTLLEYRTGFDLHVDQALFTDTGNNDFPGRMSPITAVDFVFIGAGILLSDRRAGQRVAEWFALAVGLSAVLALLGYAYGVRSLYAVGLFSSVAFHTAIAFAAVSLAILFAHPEGGLMRVVVSDGPGGVLARRMLPASILVPTIIGSLRLQGQRAGLYDTQFGLALFASSSIVCFAVLTFWNAGALFRSDVARRQAEAAAQEREEDLATTLNSIGDAVIATDARGLVTRMNPVAEKLTAWPLAEARGRRLDEVFPIASEDTKEPVESPVDRVLREGIVVGLANHTVLTSRDQVERPIADSGAPIRDAKGFLRGVVLVFRDMTEEREAERALAKSQALYRQISDSGIVGIVLSDLSSNVTEANDAFLRIIGYSREDLLAGRIRAADLTPPDWQHTQDTARAELMASGMTSPWEKEFVRKDGSRVPVLIAVAKLEPPLVVSIVADLTDLKRSERDQAQLDAKARMELAGRERAEAALRQTEDQLRHAQKMEAVGRLAGGIAHDFNNILTVILSYSDTMLTEVKPGDPLRKDIEEIRTAGKRAADLTRQLLLFSRQQVLEPRVLDVNDLLGGMERMLRRLVGEDVELVFASAASLGKVRVDPGSLEQVVMNLAVNARDAMPVGGKLTIETANAMLDEAYAKEHLGTKPGPHVLLAVSDTGIGMDRATQARIFEPFFTTKETGKGTGLGLSTVFGIVQQSGGSVWVYSEPGKGTTFKVYLPLAEGEVVQARSPSASPANLRGSQTILLVEDEDQVRTVACNILKRKGYRVLEAQSPGEALLLSERHSGTIDLLLTDVVMPQMSGPELARRLSTLRPTMKVLCMSGYTDDAVVRHGAVESGIVFLQKPFTPDTLTRKVRDALEGERHAST
jgi:PAS domain S-box-containing protein